MTHVAKETGKTPAQVSRELGGTCMLWVQSSVMLSTAHDRSPLRQNQETLLLFLDQTTGIVPLKGLLQTNTQVILKWNMQRGIAVIPKASSESHLRENIDGCFDWKLSNEHKVSHFHACVRTSEG